MFGLRSIFDQSIRTAARRATAFLQAAHPEFKVHYASLRAEEETRYVFAVFFSRINTQVKPTPYGLVAVSRTDDSAEELLLTLESPYSLGLRR